MPDEGAPTPINAGWRAPTHEDLRRAAYWMDVLLTKGGYPAPARLKAHLAASEPTSFCGCGCNTFNVTVDQMAPQLGSPEASGMVFETAFRTLQSDRSVEILLFLDKAGYLFSIEIDCCWNNFPVPDQPHLEPVPYYVSAHASLREDV